MEYIELEFLSDDKVSYRYYPEGGDEYGIVTLMRKTDEVIHDKVYDVSGMYKWQAVNRMQEYNETGEFPKKAMVAWY